MTIEIHVLDDGNNVTGIYVFETIKDAVKKCQELKKQNAVFINWLVDRDNNIAIELDPLA